MGGKKKTFVLRKEAYGRRLPRSGWVTSDGALMGKILQKEIRDRESRKDAYDALPVAENPPVF